MDEDSRAHTDKIYALLAVVFAVVDAFHGKRIAKCPDSFCEREA